MTSKKVMLSVPDKLLKDLEKEKEKYAYASVQEIILETLREKLYKSKQPKKEKRGRPRKFDDVEFLTRKGKIFT